MPEDARGFVLRDTNRCRFGFIMKARGLSSFAANRKAIREEPSQCDDIPAFCS
jgi:hypothetical protein